MSAERVLVVNADDFGITEGVNRAIIECHRAGNVTSTTLMVNMPAAGHAVELAEQHRTLGVGWHANLTLGRPVSSPEDVPSLVGPDGCFPSRAQMERRLVLGQVRQADLERELEAQLRRFLAWNRRPTHVDSHQHVHVFPRVFDALAALATRESLPLRMPWRWRGPQRPGLKKWVRAAGMDLLLKRNAHRWRGQLRCNEGFCSLFDLTYSARDIAGPLYERLLSAYRTGGVVELMVHPAHIDAALRSLTSITAFSQAEARFLATPELERIAQGLGFRLDSYGCLSSGVAASR